MDYLFLTTFLICAFVIAGYKISADKDKSTKKYWKRLLFPILLFTIIEGLRYARGVDYLHYVYVYQHNNLKELDQPVFTLFNYFLRYIKVPFYGAFMCYSFFYIASASLLISNFKRTANFLFPVLFFSTLVFFEAFIRQYFAVSFLYISLHYFINNKWIKGVGAGLLGIMSHSSIAVIFPVFFLIKYYNKPFNIYASVGLYIFFSYIYNVKNIDLLLPYLTRINLGNLYFNQYIENADHWFSSSAIDFAYKQSLPAKLATSIFEISVIVVFYIFYKKKKFKIYRNENLYIFYNLFVLGALMFQTFFLFEIPRRIALVFLPFNFIVIAYILKVYRYSICKNILISVCVYYIYAYMIIWFCKYMFFSGNKLFIWSVNSFHVL